ncbi:MAG TPA: hypothetical protein PKB13_06935 [Clostridia bacterium]|nr:hypothetical protein [Clostridia bacterium]
MSIDIGLAVILIIAAFLIGLLIGRSGKSSGSLEQRESSTEHEKTFGGVTAYEPVPYAPDTIDRGRFDAAVAAAIASYLGEDVSGLRIHSVKLLSRKAMPRQPMVAAISAAIATVMGTDVSGLRIRSIRRIGAAAPNRQQMVAAISAAIATAMNTEIDGLRIRSIKKIS